MCVCVCAHMMRDQGWSTAGLKRQNNKLQEQVACLGEEVCMHTCVCVCVVVVTRDGDT